MLNCLDYSRKICEEQCRILLCCLHFVIFLSALLQLYANSPITMFSSAQVGQLREISNKAQNAELKLFLEVEFGLVTGVAFCMLFILECVVDRIQVA